MSEGVTRGARGYCTVWTQRVGHVSSTCPCALLSVSERARPFVVRALLTHRRPLHHHVMCECHHRYGLTAASRRRYNIE